MTYFSHDSAKIRMCFISPSGRDMRSAHDNNDSLEAGLMNLPRIAQVVHNHPPDDSSKADNAVICSYKPSRESIMMMHGELDGSSTHEAQKMSSESAPSNNPRTTETAPGTTSCCLIL